MILISTVSYQTIRHRNTEQKKILKNAVCSHDSSSSENVQIRHFPFRFSNNCFRLSVHEMVFEFKLCYLQDQLPLQGLKSRLTYFFVQSKLLLYFCTCLTVARICNLTKSIVCLFVWVYGISTVVGYLMPNPFLYK